MPCQIVLNLTMQAELNINSNKLLLFWYNGLFQKKSTPPPTDGILEILAGGGVEDSGNPGGRGGWP